MHDLGYCATTVVLAMALIRCGGNDDDSGNGDTATGSHSEPDASGDAGDTMIDEEEVWPAGKYISTAAVFEKTGQATSDMLLVNVSDEAFYDMGHIEGSLKIPWDTLAENLDSVDRTRHIVIYCRKGVRSESAYDTLVAAGYEMVWVMEGGLEIWIAEGYPVVDE